MSGVVSTVARAAPAGVSRARTSARTASGEGVRQPAAVLRSEVQCVREQAHRAHPVVRGPAALQPADGAHAHPGPFGHLFLRQVRTVAQRA